MTDVEETILIKKKHYFLTQRLVRAKLHYNSIMEDAQALILIRSK